MQGFYSVGFDDDKATAQLSRVRKDVCLNDPPPEGRVWSRVQRKGHIWYTTGNRFSLPHTGPLCPTSLDTSSLTMCAAGEAMLPAIASVLSPPARDDWWLLLPRLPLRPRSTAFM
jgi:hypothetical protein